MKRIGLDPALRVHDFRHTYATNSYAAGADIRSLAEELGHHDPAFTLRTNGRSTNTMKKDAAGKMGLRMSQVEIKLRMRTRMEKAKRTS